MSTQKSSAFMQFVAEWKKKNGAWVSVDQAVSAAGNIWKDMTEEQRAPYKNASCDIKCGRSGKKKEKLTNFGIPVSQIIKQQKEAQRMENSKRAAIAFFVEAADEAGALYEKKFYLADVNFFTYLSEIEKYVPAEIAIIEFSLGKGVSRKYHTFVNPQANFTSYAYKLKEHASTTHNLPLPPNALGETDTLKIYSEIMELLFDSDEERYNPLYTHENRIEIVESALSFLLKDKKPKRTVVLLSMNTLFFDLICQANKDEDTIPKNHFTTDRLLELDPHEYAAGIACTYHENMDKCKYCCLSQINRWAFAFFSYISKKVPGDFIPEQHEAPDKNDTLVGSDGITDMPMQTSSNHSFISIGNSKSPRQHKTDMKRHKKIDDSDEQSDDTISRMSLRGKQKTSKNRFRDELDSSSDDDNVWSAMTLMKRAKDNRSGILNAASSFESQSNKSIQFEEFECSERIFPEFECGSGRGIYLHHDSTSVLEQSMNLQQLLDAVNKASRSDARRASKTATQPNIDDDSDEPRVSKVSIRPKQASSEQILASKKTKRNDAHRDHKMESIFPEFELDRGRGIYLHHDTPSALEQSINLQQLRDAVDNASRSDARRASKTVTQPNIGDDSDEPCVSKVSIRLKQASSEQFLASKKTKRNDTRRDHKMASLSLMGYDSDELSENSSESKTSKTTNRLREYKTVMQSSRSYDPDELSDDSVSGAMSLMAFKSKEANDNGSEFLSVTSSFKSCLNTSSTLNDSKDSESVLSDFELGRGRGVYLQQRSAPGAGRGTNPIKAHGRGIKPLSSRGRGNFVGRIDWVV